MKKAKTRAGREKKRRGERAKPGAAERERRGKRLKRCVRKREKSAIGCEIEYDERRKQYNDG